MTYRKQRSYKWHDMRLKRSETRQAVSCLAPGIQRNLRAIVAGTDSHQVQEAAAALAVYLSRRDIKHKFDHERDTRDRVTIGGRYSRRLADQVKAAATAREMSVYAWVQEAICEKLARETPPPPSGSPR